ncbi:MAG: hypothetical protein ACRDTH_26815, partial [Pseudonocardiaceae bacterium]
RRPDMRENLPLRQPAAGPEPRALALALGLHKARRGLPGTRRPTRRRRGRHRVRRRGATLRQDLPDCPVHPETDAWLVSGHIAAFQTRTAPALVQRQPRWR